MVIPIRVGITRYLLYNIIPKLQNPPLYLNYKPLLDFPKFMNQYD